MKKPTIIFPMIRWAAQKTPRQIKPPLRIAYSGFMSVPLLKRLIFKVDTLDGCHSYWENPTDYNNRAGYDVVENDSASEFMLGVISRYSKNGDTILEIGCNSGRNLSVLYEAGHKNLAGVEINTEATEILKERYPEMAKGMELYNKPVEEVIKGLADRRYLTFTVATLEHIHPDSQWIFGEMVRITDRYLITLEDEVSYFWRTFKRNYQKVFEGLGMKQVEFNNCDSLPNAYSSFKLRVFEKGVKDGWI